MSQPLDTPTEITCLSCRHSVPRASTDVDDDDERNAWGVCTRYPPIVYIQRGQVQQTFPSAITPCGEHDPEPSRPAHLARSLPRDPRRSEHPGPTWQEKAWRVLVDAYATRRR